MSDPDSRVLVTGATGFIGRRLVPALVERGPRRPGDDPPPRGVRRAGRGRSAATCTTPPRWPTRSRASTWPIYLVHSLDDPDFERKDAEAARAFGEAAAAAGVRQIVYLGGLGADDDELSAAPALAPRGRGAARRGRRAGHRAARRRSWSAHGGISWELTRQLVKNLPAMVVPNWVATRTQPIALDDVVRYLVGVVGQRRGARPGLRDRRPRPADLPRDAAGRRRDRRRAPGADRPGAGADARGCRRTGWRWSPTSTSPPAAT